MAQTRETTDIADVDNLRDLAEEVRASGRPRLLVANGEEVAMLVPPRVGNLVVRDELPEVELTPEKLSAFRAAFGSWKGHLDQEEFKAQIKAARGSRRPPVELPSHVT